MEIKPDFLKFTFEAIKLLKDKNVSFPTALGAGQAHYYLKHLSITNCQT